MTAQHQHMFGPPLTEAVRRIPSKPVALVSSALLLVAFATVDAGIAWAAVPAQEPDLYTNARAALAAGDTAAALSGLRKLTKTHSDFAPGWGLLGRVLTAKASGVATDFRERKEADKALRRALKLEPGHPLYLMALGELMRKQQMYLDGRRVLNRAFEAMEENPDRLPESGRGDLWFQRGLYYEDVYLDTRHLRFVTELPVQTPDCAGLGAFCLNFTRPKRFNEYFRYAADLSDEGEDEFEWMVNAFRRALDANPTHRGAFRRLAIHLIDRGAYAEARELARRYQHNVPHGPWGYMTLGLVYHRTGLDSLAEIEFDRGLENATPTIAAHYRDVSSLLRESLAKVYHKADDDARKQVEGVLWRKSDPLYITSANEVRVAHLARVTYADLMFEDPSSGIWGAETEQGIIYARYGPPERIWKIPRNPQKEASSLAFRGAQGGGRWIFWNYGWEVPNFIFEKQLRWRHASHVLSSYSKSMEEEARKAQPAIFTTSFDILGYPVQVARFRGDADSVVEVDFYSEVPADRLLEDPDSLDLGIFVFGGAGHQRIYERSLTLRLAPEPKGLTYSLPLLAGRYTFSLEARSPAGKAAVRRVQLDLEPFRDAKLALSDLVLADDVTAKTPRPTDRRDFAIQVNRRREYEPEAPLALYWEVYGLLADDEGFARYRVKLSVTDAGGGGVFAKIGGAIGNLFGLSDDEQLELSFERLAELQGDRVPEYLSLELAKSDAGPYRVRIEVTDLAGGDNAVIEREFRVGPP